jgi:hypothetical protein
MVSGGGMEEVIIEEFIGNHGISFMCIKIMDRFQRFDGFQFGDVRKIGIAVSNTN